MDILNNADSGTPRS